jgi:glycosyltransferase involved in cell wall biosynthesis
MFGMSFRTGEVEDLRQKMEFLIYHAEIVKVLGQRARRYVADNFAWDRIVQENLKVYRDLKRGEKEG